MLDSVMSSRALVEFVQLGQKKKNRLSVAPLQLPKGLGHNGLKGSTQSKQQVILLSI